MAAIDDLIELVRDEVLRVLSIDDDTERREELEEVAASLFEVAHDEQGGVDTSRVDAFRLMMGENLTATAATDPEADAEARADRIARILAKAANGAAFVAAAAAEPQAMLTWVTMNDESVREIHRPLHGRSVVAGGTFDVGGFPLQYPGQPVGPPEVWINCRCTLAVGGPVVAASDPSRPLAAATTDTVLARSFDTKTRKAMAKRHTAMPDGSFPIANAKDLRNAIQAIGRAKDPDKAKAHIRRRARALGLTSLIPKSWTASVADATLIAVDTHDAPGWIANPRETQRLRNYWTRGAGAAKVGWGSPGDLTRCASYISKYVLPGYVWGTCQNLHYEALGYFNPESRGQRGDGSTETDQVHTAFAAAAELEDDVEHPPLEHFTNPGLQAATPYSVDPADENHIYGHLASWETCHVGREGCVPPPRSTHDYAYFSTGEVVTAGGPVPVGQITMNTGHATEDMDPRATVAHYDDTGTVVADVAVGEDDYGIWFNGQLRPGITPEQRHGLHAGALSGDWRRIGGNLELVAALAVNVPGFPIPREQLTVAASGAPMALVAAAIVTTDPNAEMADHIAELVVGKMDGRKAAEARAVRAAALIEMTHDARVDRLLELVGG